MLSSSDTTPLSTIELLLLALGDMGEDETHPPVSRVSVKRTGTRVEMKFNFQNNQKEDVCQPSM